MGQQQKHRLMRELGLAEALAIGLGTMVGASIFVLSAIAAERAGPAVSVIALPSAFAKSQRKRSLRREVH
jgi:amino acid transporter